MRRWKLAPLTLLTLFLGACGSGNKTVVTVSVFPPSAFVVLGGSQQFTATVQGTSNTAVTWSVSGSGCSGSGNPCGMITPSTGLYTAPNTLPNPPTVTVKATSQAASNVSASATVTLDSGIRVSLSPARATVGTGEFLTLTPTVTGPTSNTTLTWTVNMQANGNSTVGQICVHVPPAQRSMTPCTAPSGAASGPVDYLAPSTAPAASVTIQATSAADSTKSGTATMTVRTALPPALASISPTTAAQGSVFQDVHLSGNNFFTTSTVLANGTAVPTTFLTTMLLRARIPSCISGLPNPPCPGNLLQNAGPSGTSGTIALVVQSQSGTASSPVNLTVTPVRPAIVSANPASVPQSTSTTPSGACASASSSVNLNGGFFSPSTTAVFNGQAANTTPSVISPNQLNVGITVPAATNPPACTNAAGLFQLVVLNSGAAQPMAAVNLAVQPLITSNPPSTIAPSPLSVGMQPSAVAVNIATNKAVVANRGDNTISVISLGTAPTVAATIPVGMTPTGVAVDNQRNLALVVNQVDNTLSVVDLSGTNPTQTLALPTGTTPVSVGVNPLTSHALVANQLTNTATVIDLSPLPSNPPVVLGTANISTGLNPTVAVEPRLDWAIVTPGGAGTVSVVDMSHTAIDPTTGKPTFIVVATKSGEPTLQGVAINPETDEVLMTNPSSTGAETFSLLDQTTVGFQLEANHVAAAVNPLTNIGVTVNSQLNAASIIDLGTPIRLGSPIPVGVNPVAVAIDPASNVAVVANQGDNTVSILSLGAIRSLHITQISPATTFTSAPTPTLTVTGNGFVCATFSGTTCSTSASVVRLDQMLLATAFVSSRQLTATVPASMLGSARRFAVEVQNTATGEVSNVAGLTVIQPVPVGTAPGAVAIGQVIINNAPHDLAAVTNTGSNNISVIDLANPATCPIANCTITVGTDPEGVDVVSRIGRAVVTNRGDGTVSLVDLVNGIVTSTVSVGQQPIGVAINSDTLVTAVTNSVSNSLSLFAADTGAGLGTIAMDQRPVALAIDVGRNLAAVANATGVLTNPPQGNVDLVDLTNRFIVGRASIGFQVPNGVAFDPVSDAFLIANSLINNVDIVDPGTLQVTPFRVGINPTSIAYNFLTSTLVTVNSASHTASVTDFLGRRVRAVLAVDGSPQQSVAIDPQTNLAVVADQKNNRVLLVPLPR